MLFVAGCACWCCLYVLLLRVFVVERVLVVVRVVDIYTCCGLCRLLRSVFVSVVVIWLMLCVFVVDRIGVVVLLVFALVVDGLNDLLCIGYVVGVVLCM